MVLIVLQFEQSEQIRQKQESFDATARATSLRTMIGVLSNNREAYYAELANLKQISPDIGLKD